jgi:pimeloyl-ACP methyl ester carboxylesterase
MQKLYNYGNDSLSYIDEGNGPVSILLIHGFGEDNKVWINQIAFLSKHYRIIAPNLPGVHCKPLQMQTNETPGINHYVEILHALMHNLHIEKYFIMGHSMGGYIGLAFADYYTNHVQGLGLIHSTTYADSEVKKESRLKVAAFLQASGTKQFLETATPSLFGPPFKLAHPEQIQQLIDRTSDISSEAMIQFVMAMYKRKPYTHILQQNKIPVLLIAGDADMAVPFEDSIAQAKLLPPENVILLKGIGHMGMLEASQQVSQGILEFVTNISH